MSIQRRSVSRSRKRLLFTTNDIFFCFEMPLILSVSWLLPGKYWNAVCFFFVKVKAAFGFPPRPVASVVSQVIGHNQIAGDPASFNLKHAAIRSEDALQVFRSYRPGGWNEPIVLEGEDHLRAALAMKRGVVLWVGNFCFGSLATKKALFQAGYKVWHLSRPEHGYSNSQFGVRFLNPVCTRVEDRYLAGRIRIDRDSPNKATIQAARHLRQNEMVSITATVSEGKTLFGVELFGGMLELAIGAPSLATLCGSSLLPVFTVREESGTIRVVIGEPLVHKEGLDKEHHLQFLMQGFADRLAPWILKYPNQWIDWRRLSLPEPA